MMEVGILNSYFCSFYMLTSQHRLAQLDVSDLFYENNEKHALSCDFWLLQCSSDFLKDKEYFSEQYFKWFKEPRWEPYLEIFIYKEKS